MGSFEVHTGDMIKASMAMMDVMRGVRDTAIGLAGELQDQQGMAGDDDAGHAFAKVYKSAAATTLDQIGYSSYVMGATGAGLMRSARAYMATENQISADLLGKQEDATNGMGDPSKGCTSRFLGLGQELPEVVGETAWYDQFAPGGGDRYRGSAEKAQDAAASWRHAAKLMERFLGEAQACAATVRASHAGEAADSFQRYFKRCIGTGAPPSRAQADEPLIANLVGACTQLANACEAYAGHIKTALADIAAHNADFFRIDLPWEQPILGGNGYDGGLNDAVLGDPRIQQLGTVAHSLDAAQARVRLPGGNDAPRPPLLPGGGIRLPVPVLLASASGTGSIQQIMAQGADPGIPHRDPMPPAHPNLLSPAEQANFRSWMHSLPAGGFAGGGNAGNPDNAYQLRVAGYPEREVPLPPEATGRSGRGLMVDGLRPADGYAVEAKYVREPDCKKTFRSLDAVDATLGIPVKVDDRGNVKFDPRRDAMYPKDENELVRYHEAMNDPRNTQLRGLEIITNDRESSAYWQSMMAMSGVKGTTRYVP
ncbi:restriction endonuclease fold toxin-2 domain-containing protein [Streptomyces chrestomyceticus]|uniref:restriction endonuclease fold toxin-2 domain-containing protein n=1 Tax=Streptomyces chrestomyceticus TaxID=68185 RepID=UPI0033DD3B35